MAIHTDMSGSEIDRVLKAINDAANAGNNGKIVCIQDGALGFVDGEAYFTVTELEEET